MKKMKETINQLKTLLPAEQFIVTGSYALNCMGLGRANGDLDIILTKPTEETLKTLERLQKHFPAKTSPYAGRMDMFIFMYNGIKIDIFISNKPENTSLQFDGITIATANHIITAKKNMNRLKDWIQLRNMSREFCKTEDFTNFINKC